MKREHYLTELPENFSQIVVNRICWLALGAVWMYVFTT